MVKILVWRNGFEKLMIVFFFCVCYTYFFPILRAYMRISGSFPTSLINYFITYTIKQTELVKCKVVQQILVKTNFVVCTEIWLASLGRWAILVKKKFQQNAQLCCQRRGSLSIQIGLHQCERPLGEMRMAGDLSMGEIN